VISTVKNDLQDGAVILAAWWKEVSLHAHVAPFSMPGALGASCLSAAADATLCCLLLKTERRGWPSGFSRCRNHACKRLWVKEERLPSNGFFLSTRVDKLMTQVSSDADLQR